MDPNTRVMIEQRRDKVAYKSDAQRMLTERTIAAGLETISLALEQAKLAFDTGDYVTTLHAFTAVVPIIQDVAGRIADHTLAATEDGVDRIGEWMGDAADLSPDAMAAELKQQVPAESHRTGGYL